MKKKQKHELIDNTLVSTNKGIIARCTCGWTSGYRFSSMVASVAFMDHEEDPDRDGIVDDDE